MITLSLSLSLSLSRRKISSKNDFALSANVAYGLVNIEGGGEYVTPDELALQSMASGSQEPRYESHVGRESVLYDLPASQSSPQPTAVVYAVPHETVTRQNQM